jgi:hypothetical protein
MVPDQRPDMAVPLIGKLGCPIKDRRAKYAPMRCNSGERSQMLIWLAAAQTSGR